MHVSREFSIFALFCVVCNAYEQWTLRRADESRVIFKNTTVVGDFTTCTWTWLDSLGGLWDTWIRISFKNDSYKGGGFHYKDAYGRELLRVRWYQTAYRNLTWKSLFSDKFPSTWWNLSTSYTSWGYAATEYWSFVIDNYTITPKPTYPVNPFFTEILVPIRKKRSIRGADSTSHRSADLRGFNIIDLFTGNGIFSQVPQLLINLFSFVSSIFPSGTDDYEVPDDPTEPEAEMVTPSSTAPKLVRKLTTPRL